MQNQYINIYNGNPTKGAIDGMLVSYDGLQTNPVGATLNGNAGDSKTIKLAVRCTDGFCAPKGIKLSLENDDLNQWSFSETPDGTFEKELQIGTAVTDVNTIFYVKVTTDVGIPRKNTDVIIIVDAEIENSEG